MKSLFEMKQVIAGYGQSPVLNTIDLSINRGDFVSIVGPNGAGKSTILRLLTGTMYPLSGMILYNGQSLHAYSNKELAKQFSVVNQFYSNVLAFTVYQFVRMGRFPFQKVWEIENDSDRACIDEALAITGIEHLRDRPLTGLSAGEKQLVYIAHALCQNREVVILDEPISHLDIKHMSGIMDVLYSLYSQGSTIIAVLHNINIAADYSNVLCGVRDGNIICSGQPKSVITEQNIKKLFDADCIVHTNEVTGNPYILSIPGFINKEGNN